MGRLCERPGCSAAAAMAYGFDASRLLVWLVPHDPSDDRLRAGVLCARHAEAMIVPRGWTLDDRRDDRPRLFRALPDAEAPTPRPRRRPPRPSDAEQLVLGAEEPTVAEVTGVVAGDGVDVDATVAMPWRPEFDENDDLGGVLAADTPLLSRAFRGTERTR